MALMAGVFGLCTVTDYMNKARPPCLREPAVLGVVTVACCGILGILPHMPCVGCDHSLRILRVPCEITAPSELLLHGEDGPKRGPASGYLDEVHQASQCIACTALGRPSTRASECLGLHPEPPHCQQRPSRAHHFALPGNPRTKRQAIIAQTDCFLHHL